ncbi:hypothetical protein NHH03_22915 [Stieleria sp. TO1_6]|uniref:hypothetical protein n=1 Tax=Stieleria tagensis TaxID=2956795 RepID=UPI00209AFDF8|nr:hypothetical protein [Stieleria tagensis]MCO8124608.1 hypothetical protein [Stieleria tagensis]
MTNSDKKKLLATNAAVWVSGILAAFILPLIAESLSDGPGGFLKVMAFAFPLIVAMFVSHSVISRAIDVPTE